MNKKYLMVKCEPLDDQWECDAHRTPLYITDNIRDTPDCEFYDIYEIKGNGACKRIKYYED